MFVARLEAVIICVQVGFPSKEISSWGSGIMVDSRLKINGSRAQIPVKPQEVIFINNC